MKPFSLDTVLNHRKRLLNLARGRFAEAQSEYNTVKLQVEQCVAERSGLIDTLAERQRDGIDIDEHVRFANRIDLLKTELERLQRRLQKKHEIVLRERQHLLQKSKEHQVLQRLKQRQDAQWRQYLERNEAKALDEVAIMANTRKYR
ncbi:MAG: flagellar export protein FliJ [Desulfobulbaceae bacterium]|nr:flagellar export protein FliJ [Desulfobulbaceae bacterium]